MRVRVREVKARVRVLVEGAAVQQQVVMVVVIMVLTVHACEPGGGIW